MPRPYTDLSNPPRLGCRVGARCVSLRGVVGIIVTGRGIVPLELFANRARRASPLQRSIELTAPGMLGRRPLRSSAGRRRHHRDGPRNCSVGAVYKPGEACLAPTQIYRTHRTWVLGRRPLRFSAGRRRHHRDGPRNCSVGAVYKPGEACLAPTQIYRTHRAWDAASAPVAFFCGTSSASS